MRGLKPWSAGGAVVVLLICGVAWLLLYVIPHIVHLLDRIP
jgi:hypothetical protein